MLTSAILFEALRRKYPKAELHYLINAHTMPVVENNPFINKFIVFSPTDKKSIGKRYRFIQRIKAENYTVVIDVYAKIFSALVTYFSKASIRIGIKKNYLKKAYTHSFENNKQPQKGVGTAFENRLHLLQPLIDEIDYGIRPKLFLKADEKQQMAKLLKTKNIAVEQHDYIMVNVFGSSALKTYPLPYLAQLLDALAEALPSIKFLFNYMPSQEGKVQKLTAQCAKKTKSRIDHFYAPDLRGFIVLTSFCKAVIGNEGGGINIGKALDLPTFAIFSPWIRKEVWGSSQKDPTNQAVHLGDFKPETIQGKSKKELKDKSLELYQHLKPTLFIDQLIDFLTDLTNTKNEKTSTRSSKKT